MDECMSRLCVLETRDGVIFVCLSFVEYSSVVIFVFVDVSTWWVACGLLVSKVVPVECANAQKW